MSWLPCCQNEVSKRPFPRAGVRMKPAGSRRAFRWLSFLRKCPSCAGSWPVPHTPGAGRCLRRVGVGTEGTRVRVPCTVPMACAPPGTWNLRWQSLVKLVQPGGARSHPRICLQFRQMGPDPGPQLVPRSVSHGPTNIAVT